MMVIDVDAGGAGFYQGRELVEAMPRMLDEKEDAFKN